MKKQILMFMFSTLENVPPLMNEGSSLADAGYKVRVLGLRYEPSQPAKEEIVPGFYIHRMTLLTRKLFGSRDSFEFIRYMEVALRSFLWGVSQPAALFVAHDLVTLPYVYPLAKLRRRAVVYRAHEIWSEQLPNFPRALFWRKLDKFFSRNVDLIVCPESNRASIYREEYGYPKAPVVIYNNPKFMDRPTQSPLRERLLQLGITCEYIVYYQGGLGPARSVDHLVHAVRYLPENIGLALIGTPVPEFVTWLESFIREHHVQHRIAFLGSMPYGPRLFELCSGADIGVAFAKGDCRNNLFSATATNKLFEYMMMGIPVLASNFSSYKQIVEREHIGTCVDSEDPRSIADGIMMILHDPESMKRMRENCLRLAREKYNWDRAFPELLNEYRNLIIGRA